MDASLYYEDTNVYYDDDRWPEVEKLGKELVQALTTGNTAIIPILTRQFLDAHQFALNISGLGTARQKVADCVTDGMQADKIQQMLTALDELDQKSREAITHITKSLADFEKALDDIS